jgi:hypothetical protein
MPYVVLFEQVLSTVQPVFDIHRDYVLGHDTGNGDIYRNGHEDFLFDILNIRFYLSKNNDKYQVYSPGHSSGIL